MIAVIPATTTKPSEDAIRATSRKTFDHFDADKSGTISRQELRDILIALRQRHSDAHIDAMVASTGLSQNESAFDFDHFLRLLSPRTPLEIKRDQLRQIYAAFDLDYSGYITAAKLRHFLAKIHIHLCDDEIAQLVDMFDLDGNAQITIDEFEVIVRKLGFTVIGEPDQPKHQSDKESAFLDSTKVSNKTRPRTNVQSEAPIHLEGISDPRIREALQLFDTNNIGQITLSDLHRAADMLRKHSAFDKRVSDPALHWDPNRELLGLAPYIQKMNHIALIVSDVGCSTRFYVDVMGFQQIRRPNFDRHGAWFTMGNVELHLIKGTPVVHSGDDLIVSHISIETTRIDKVPATLRRLGVPFRQNVSVPKAKDAGKGTNISDTSEKIVRQFFVRDPDGYYIEICDCDVLTGYSLGEDAKLPGYREEIEALCLENAAVTINLIHRWNEVGRQRFAETKEMFDKVKATDGSISAVAQLLDCEMADTVNTKLLDNLVTRTSVYGDVCQNETPDQLKEIVLASGNDSFVANRIMMLRQEFRGQQKMQPPAFYEQGQLVKPPALNVRSSLKVPKL